MALYFKFWFGNDDLTSSYSPQCRFHKNFQVFKAKLSIFSGATLSFGKLPELSREPLPIAGLILVDGSILWFYFIWNYSPCHYNGYYFHPNCYDYLKLLTCSIDSLRPFRWCVILDLKITIPVESVFFYFRNTHTSLLIAKVIIL